MFERTDRSNLKRKEMYDLLPMPPADDPERAIFHRDSRRPVPRRSYDQMLFVRLSVLYIKWKSKAGAQTIEL